MREIIIKVIAEQMNVAQELVTRTAFLVDDLGADWLDVGEIAMELEEVFDLDFPDNGEGWVTVQDVFNAVAHAVGEAGA